jgi:acyl dehydratase
MPTGADEGGSVYFEDVTEGDTAPVFQHTLTRTDMVVYAGASGDFNPMHHDEIKATAAGMPSVFGHGMLSAGLLATALTRYVGLGNLRRYQVRFTKPALPDDVLSTAVTVTGKRLDGGEGLVDLECGLVTAAGSVVVSGSATAALPLRPGRPPTDLEGTAV